MNQETKHTHIPLVAALEMVIERGGDLEPAEMREIRDVITEANTAMSAQKKRERIKNDALVRLADDIKAHTKDNLGASCETLKIWEERILAAISKVEGGA